MFRIDMKKAACISLSAMLAVGLFAGPASARWGDNNYNNNGYNNGYHGNHGDRDWNSHGYYYRDPPVIYSAPSRYYQPPPVVYGPQFSVPGVTIQIR
jgi:hypothetical protein